MRHTARSNTAPPVAHKLSRSGGKGKETLEDLAGRHFGRQVEVVLLFCVLFWFGFVLVGLRGRCICQCILSRPPQTLLLRQKQKQNRSRDSGERKATSILLIYHALYPRISKCGVVTHSVQARAGIHPQSLLDWH